MLTKCGLAGNWQWSGWVCLAPALAGQSGTQPVVALMAKLVMEIKDQTLLARLPSPQQTYLVSLVDLQNICMRLHALCMQSPASCV